MVLATKIQYQSNNSYGNFRGQSKRPEKSHESSEPMFLFCPLATHLNLQICTCFQYFSLFSCRIKEKIIQKSALCLMEGNEQERETKHTK